MFQTFPHIFITTRNTTYNTVFKPKVIISFLSRTTPNNSSKLSVSSILHLVFFSILFLNSCDNNHFDKPNNNLLTDSLNNVDTIPVHKIDLQYCQSVQDSLNNLFEDINYSQLVIHTPAELIKFRTEFQLIDSIPEQKEKWRAISTLNRKELRFVRVGDTVIIPDKIKSDLRAYSVFPPTYCDASYLPKLIVVSNVYQSYACYEYGKLVRFAAANTGKESTPTYPGRYSLVWKQRLRMSSLDSTWILPFTFNFHQYAGNAFHQFEMPGRPVSHSCVRQFMDDAQWLYSWGKRAEIDSNHRFISGSGTPVLMLGMFDYDRKRGGVWIDEISNKVYPVKLSGDPMQVEEALIPIDQIPRSSRGALPNRKRYVTAEDTLRVRGVIRDHISIIPSIDFNKRRRERNAAKARLEKIEKGKLESEQGKQTEQKHDNDNKNNAE